MDRRTLLKRGGLGALSLALGGCATGSGRTAQSLSLVPVRVSWDRIIRTTVGLRPHRPAGFVLGAGRLDGKTLVHNYGHGGAGMSLSWGTGYMAAEMATEQEGRRAAVIGCGVAGLTTARQLQRRGFDVTIYAMAVPPNTTSNMSLASFTPTSGLYAAEERTPRWDRQFRRAVDIAYKQLQLLIGPKYGISWINNYSMMNEAPGNGATRERDEREPALMPPGLRTGQTVLGPGEHPFPSRYAAYRPTMRFEPSIYLDALVSDFLLFGGNIVIRKFDTPRDLTTLDEPVIVNCSGLGSYDLFRDHDLTPLKGQLTVLVPQPEVDYNTGGGIPGSTRGGFIHMQPRSDGIILGGTSQAGEWSLEPDEEALRRVVESHMEMFGAMRRSQGGMRIATSGRPSTVPAVESFFGRDF